MDAALNDFAQRRGMRIGEAARGRRELRRGSRELTGEHGAQLTHEENLPLKGSIEVSTDRQGTVRISARFAPDRMGVLAGRGPLRGGVRRRYEQLFGELLADFGQSIGADA